MEPSPTDVRTLDAPVPALMCVVFQPSQDTISLSPHCPSLKEIMVTTNEIEGSWLGRRGMLDSRSVGMELSRQIYLGRGRMYTR